MELLNEPMVLLGLALIGISILTEIIMAIVFKKTKTKMIDKIYNGYR